MLGVVLEHVRSIVRLDEGVVDGDYVYIAMLNGIPEDLCSQRLRDLEGWIWLTIRPIRPKPLMPTLVSTILIVYSDQRIGVGFYRDWFVITLIWEKEV